jgi:hypothetical protein
MMFYVFENAGKRNFGFRIRPSSLHQSRGPMERPIAMATAFFRG